MKRLNIVSIAILAIFYIIVLRSCMDDLKAQTIPLDGRTFKVDYSPDLGIPTKVEWSISSMDLGRIHRDPAWRFRTDRRAPRPRVTSSMYANSGYDRGHMCPAADRSARSADMRSTFIMSNVCPMAPQVNRVAWLHYEDLARKIARDRGRCSVWAAPFFYPEDTVWIGRGRVAVPHAFFKIIFDRNPSRVYAMTIIENK